MKKNNKTIAKETLDIIEHGYTTTKRIHPGYQEYENAMKKTKKLLKKYGIKQYFGKWQYIFKKGDFIISLIKLREMPLSTNKTEKWFWEIHAHEDKRLFVDCQRFPTKKAAMKQINNLLGS